MGTAQAGKCLGIGRPPGPSRCGATCREVARQLEKQRAGGPKPASAEVVSERRSRPSMAEYGARDVIELVQGRAVQFADHPDRVAGQPEGALVFEDCVCSGHSWIGHWASPCSA